ncbi:HEPN domain-containing protein [Enterobacter bugandensis]|uniref:HEPN domain-containing protein n=1 Tax=Enterobacter bugandensis TaxID=881260 RepID=UPI0020031832|nr:HEPN domain-containing protein [Enterobacter bugandensis]MCK7312796.1 HEPN domain-containing protein [Enterobacter bugandensis]MDH0086622.1 HEPN domain-containing protein [Enterobacter bugandensis]MDH0111693.1 HEPN domain-containing protein [Enterobacter bugandensis]MDH0127855.1 HEPN domain-containing protein [Enterobacter bugandensis]
MNKREMHIKSEQKIKKLVNSELLKTYLLNSFPYCEYTSRNFSEIATELNKRKVSFKIDSSQCALTFLHAINYYFEKMKEVDTGEQPFYLNEMPRDNLDELTDFISDAFKNTPANLSITFKLHNMLLPACSNHDGIIISLDKEVESIGLFATKSKEITCINFEGEGFYSPFSKNDILREYIQKLNIFFYFMIKTKAINLKDQSNINPPLMNGLGLINAIDAHMITKYSVKIVDRTYPLLPYSEVLPIGISRFISRLEINAALDKTLEEYIDVITQKSSQLYKDSSNEARRIKMAIDWYITSYANEDSVMAFLQLCMGLEAIFGDDQDQGGLTKTLGDRCAYLIGKNIRQRKNIKDAFNKIYTIRSKIVHGVINKIEHEDSYMLNYARELLQTALGKEIANLNN